MSRTVRVAREAALWAGALLGLFAVTAGVAVTLFNVSFLVFRSGSMSPTIDTGALAVAHRVEASELDRGDVVTVRTGEGALVTHRVVDATVRGDEASLVLQGDANGAPDAEVYTVRSVERVDFSVPYLGLVVAHALTPGGLVATASVCLMLLLVAAPADSSVGGPGSSGGRHRSTRKSRDPDASRGRKQAAAVVTAVAMGGAAATGGVTGTLASFNDRATMTSGSFEARTLAPPTGVACNNLFLASDYITWVAPAGLAPTGYRVYYSTNPSGPFTTVDIAATPLRWQPPSPTPYVTYYVYVAANRGSWSSAPSTQGDTITATSIIGINYFAC